MVLTLLITLFTSLMISVFNLCCLRLLQWFEEYEQVEFPVICFQFEVIWLKTLVGQCNFDHFLVTHVSKPLVLNAKCILSSVGQNVFLTKDNIQAFTILWVVGKRHLLLFLHFSPLCLQLFICDRRPDYALISVICDRRPDYVLISVISVIKMYPSVKKNHLLSMGSFFYQAFHHISCTCK